MLGSPLGRLAWNCFSLLTGAESPTGVGAAEAMRNMQDNKVKTKKSHLGYMARGGVEVEDGNLGVPSSWGPPFIIEKYCIIPRSVAWPIGVSLLMHQSSVTSIQVSEAPSLPENRTVR